MFQSTALHGELNEGGRLSRVALFCRKATMHPVSAQESTYWACIRTYGKTHDCHLVPGEFRAIARDEKAETCARRVAPKRRYRVICIYSPLEGHRGDAKVTTIHRNLLCMYVPASNPSFLPARPSLGDSWDVSLTITENLTQSSLARVLGCSPVSLQPDSTLHEHHFEQPAMRGSRSSYL